MSVISNLLKDYHTYYTKMPILDRNDGLVNSRNGYIASDPETVYTTSYNHIRSNLTTAYSYNPGTCQDSCHEKSNQTHWDKVRRASFKLIAGENCKLHLESVIKIKLNSYFENSLIDELQNFTFEMKIQKDDYICQRQVTLNGCHLSIRFRPEVAGLHRLQVSYGGHVVYSKFVSVAGFSPIHVFGRDEFWPVAVCAPYRDIYVAYTDQVCLFTEYGLCKRDLVTAADGYINDMSVNRAETYVAVAVSEHSRSPDGEHYRYQEVLIYDMKGELQHRYGWTPSVFFGPSVRICFHPADGKLLITDIDTLGVYNVDSGSMEHTVSINPLGCAARIRATEKYVYVLDASYQCVVVIDYSELEVIRRIKLDLHELISDTSTTDIIPSSEKYLVVLEENVKIPVINRLCTSMSHSTKLNCALTPQISDTSKSCRTYTNDPATMSSTIARNRPLSCISAVTPDPTTIFQTVISSKINKSTVEQRHTFESSQEPHDSKANHSAPSYSSFAVDEEKRLLLLAQVNVSRILLLSLDTGSCYGKFTCDRVKWPSDIYLNETEERVCVADYGNRKVKVYRWT